MTETTSILGVTRNLRVYAPPEVARPGVMTFIAQATLGYMLGCFLVVLGELLRETGFSNPFAALLVITMLAMVGLMGGLPVGLVLWLFAKFSNQPLSRTFRATIAILLLAISYFALALLYGTTLTPEKQFFIVRAIVIPGIVIGLLTGSRFRLWRELVRGGEARGMFPRILAGLTGFVLRVVAVEGLMASVFAVVSAVPSYYYKAEFWPPDAGWTVLAFIHFALAAIALFARMRFEVLAVLTAIANASLIASLWMYPRMPVELRYWLVGYLAAWAIFLLTRWRQTDVALAVLRKEFRYYLID